jgi:hypothetical protein
VAFTFFQEYPDITSKWMLESNYITCCSARDEQHLYYLLTKAQEKGLVHSIFTEPDLGDQLTAICFEPSEDARKLCSSLPLALKGK